MVKKLLNSQSANGLPFLVFLGFLYFVAARLGLRLALVQPYATPIWFPVGGALAAFILFGYRVWPAVLVGSFLGHATRLGWVSATFAIPIGATLEGLAGAYLVNKFAQGAKAFDTAKGVFLFVLFTCICAPSIDLSLGIGMDFLGGRSSWQDFAFKWFTWWLAHGIGVLLVAPFLILLFRSSHHRLHRREFGELILLMVGLIFVCLLVFGPLSLSLNKNGIIRVWLCIPFLIWAGFRFCQLEAAGTTLILFGSAVWGTLHGYGSFVARNLTTSLVLLDTFIGVIGTMTLVVAAMVVERRRFEEELLGTQSLLQEVVEGKKRDLLLAGRALEQEAAGHAQARKALRESQEKLRRVAGNPELVEKLQETPSRREGIE